MVPQESNPFRILVVDDNDDNRILLSRRFGKRGYLIVEAEDGLAALELIAQQEFDLILLDIMMPGLDGLEVLKRIRSSHSPDALPVIMVTAKTDTQDVVKALELGANDYLTKPVDFSIAFARAQGQLSRKRAKQELDSSLRELKELNGRLSTEIEERKRADCEVDYLRYHDPLTSLGNRARFTEQLSKELQLTRRTRSVVAVMLFDFDGFQLINNTLGNEVGDLLLINASSRLRHCIRDMDVIGRMGSDEFGVIALVAGPAEADHLADRITVAITEPYAISGHQVTLTASCGIALAPNDGFESDLVISNAELALNRAKLEGRAMRCFFEPDMNDKAQARRILEADLRKALSAGEFELFYQPLFNLAGEIMTGSEALLRWRHPKRGLVSPADFIPLAEETGVIVPVGAWVLRQACKEAATWPNGLKVAVNVSSIQVRNGSFLETVMATLAESGLPADRLELEITESVFLNDDSRTVELLYQLRRIGVRISLDDFGTGYSSLSYLQTFPFDKIKIDRSFVQEIGFKHNTMVILNALISIAKGLEMVITAEGVETQAQFDWLKLAGCTEAQGYLMSRPLPAADFRSLVNFSSHILQVA